MNKYKLSKKDYLKKLKKETVDNLKFSIEEENSKEDIAYRTGKLNGFKYILEIMIIRNKKQVVFLINTISENIIDRIENEKLLNGEWYKGFHFALNEGLEVLEGGY